MSLIGHATRSFFAHSSLSIAEVVVVTGGGSVGSFAAESGGLVILLCSRKFPLATSGFAICVLVEVDVLVDPLGPTVAFGRALIVSFIGIIACGLCA